MEAAKPKIFIIYNVQEIAPRRLRTRLGGSVREDGGNHGDGGRGRDRGIGDYQGDDQVKCDLCSFCSNFFKGRLFFGLEELFCFCKKKCLS